MKLNKINRLLSSLTLSLSLLSACASGKQLTKQEIEILENKARVEFIQNLKDKKKYFREKIDDFNRLVININEYLEGNKIEIRSLLQYRAQLNLSQRELEDLQNALGIDLTYELIKIEKLIVLIENLILELNKNPRSYRESDA